MTKLQTATLDDHKLYWRDEKGTLCWEADPGPAWAGRLCEHGLRHGLHTIWILPGSEVSKQANDVLLYASNEYDVRLKKNDQGVPTFGSVKRTGGTFQEKRLTFFGFPEHDPKWMIDSEEWAIADLEQPIELLDVLLSTEHALTPSKITRGCLEQEPFHLAYSPGYSGMDIFKKTMKLYGHVGWMKEADLSMLPSVSEPGGFLWKRPLTDEEREKKYLHFFDRNSQFPAAATGAELGEGTPDYFPPGLIHRPNLKLPGIWKILIVGGSSAITDLLPPIVHEEVSWAYSPTVQAIEALGYYVEFIEGYQWTTHHRTMQEWAKHCWEARLALRGKYGKNSPQEHLAKMIMNRGLGWLDLGVVRQEKRESEPTHRPDWYNMIRSLARYRMVIKLLELAKLGHYPVMIVADNIAYVSDDPNPETAVPGLMRRKDELGGFKSDGSYLLKEVLPLIDSLDPNAIRREVKRLEKVSFTIENINTSVGDKDIDTWLGSVQA